MLKMLKFPPFTAHHVGTLGDTDLANSKETQSREKNGCRQKWLDKSMFMGQILAQKYC